MSRPLVRSAVELPVVSFSDFDSVRQVKAAIRTLEQGIFDRAAQVVEAMTRDDRISGCLETRTQALPALPLSMEPRGDGRQKRAVAKEMDEVFEELYPNAVLAELHQWALLLGVGLAENVWEYGERRWLPKLKVWHPRFLTYRQDTQTYWVQTAEGPREVIPGDGQWVLYTPKGGRRGWMHGKVRSLYVPWLMRQWGLRDWARYSEVHGLPIKKAVTPPGAAKEDLDRFVREVAALGAESIIRTPRKSGADTAGDSNRYDVELLEAMSTNWQTFQHLLDKAETCIAVALLGQNLTTEVKGGSYAAAQAHMAIRNDVLQNDAESLAQCLREQSISWWAMHNFGSAELAPMPRWKTRAKTAEDRTARGTALKNLGEGIRVLKQAGVKLDVDKVTEEEEIPTTGPAEEPEETPLPGATPEGEQPEVRPGGKPALPRPRAVASVLLDSGDDEVPAPLIEGQSYIDALGDDGTKQLAQAIRQDIDDVLGLVADAPDYATLRKRLIEKYGEMEHEREAELLHQGMLVAELAGRYSMRRETGQPDEPSDDVDEEGAEE